MTDKETEIKPSKELKGIITYSLDKLFHNPKREYNDISEPLVSCMQKYNSKIGIIDEECADRLAKPIIWYLSDAKAINFIQTAKSGDYWRISKQEPNKIKKLADGIFKKYGETLQARLDKFKPKIQGF